MKMNKFYQILTVIVALGVAGTAGAAWEGDEKPEFDNAYTMRSGEWQIGLLRPTSVGLTDSIQLSTVMLGNLVGVVNAKLKINLVDSKYFALSVEGFGLYSFVNETSITGSGFTASVPIGDSLLVSASLGSSFASGNVDDPLYAYATSSMGGLDVSGEVSLLLNPHNILVFKAQTTYDLDCDCAKPATGGFFYAHAWDSFRLMAGVVFRGQDGFTFENDEGDSVTTPIMPVVDFWWRW